ncbi:hypothetical protein JDS92_19320 [Bacillus cereus group sp. N12]|uniref:hypothetical protein n=1 Tax=Bacillus cereus group sp. N12 TaxID=2794586 RepID=UPI0018F65641|nr:hypothetical protein [Bacillus cereus group sp. N12]MBJ8077495.1 hypothetical protein [Bacillus cereus group sp. N12]
MDTAKNNLKYKVVGKIEDLGGKKLLVVEEVTNTNSRAIAHSSRGIVDFNIDIF